jgi:hypothetical protein
MRPGAEAEFRDFGGRLGQAALEQAPGRDVEGRALASTDANGHGVATPSGLELLVVIAY